MYEGLRGIWRRLPEPIRRSSWLRKLGRKIQLSRLDKMAIRDGFNPYRKAAPAGAPVVVAGMFRSASGMGEAARSCLKALEAAGISPLAVDLTEAFARVDLDPAISYSRVPDAPSGTLLLYVNPPEMGRALTHLSALAGKEWRIVGCWMWELSEFPRDWEKAFSLVSDIWAPSTFCFEALRRCAGLPSSVGVSVVTPAIAMREDIVANRGLFGMRSGCFTALVMADTLSSLTRKNPFGAMRAFRTAFGDRDDVELIVKTRNLDLSPATAKALQDEVGGARNIRVLDGTLTDAERLVLIRSVDVLVSLHRAEGFGLTPAEAMALGTPVIATGWSGNMEFMGEDSGALVGYRLVPVQDGFGIYADPRSRWAEPDLEQAAGLLVRLAREPAWGTALARSARVEIVRRCGMDAVGRKMAGILASDPRVECGSALR